MTFPDGHGYATSAMDERAGREHDDMVTAGLIDAAIREAILAEREACAKIVLAQCCAQDACDRDCGYRTAAAEIRARS